LNKNDHFHLDKELVDAFSRYKNKARNQTPSPQQEVSKGSFLEYSFSDFKNLEVFGGNFFASLLV
jgi:hypothetical protein